MHTTQAHLKAVILAGGRGKRMRPITDYVPKPLVPIHNVPIMEWQIRYLGRFGISDIIICTGYKAAMIADRLRAKDHDGVSVSISVEDSPLGTGGAIKGAADYIGTDDAFVVLNGDVITDIDISRLVSTRNSVATIPLRTNYGTLEISDCGGISPNDDDDYDALHHDSSRVCTVTGFKEKQPISGMWMNAGIYHLGREVLYDLPDVGDIENTLFPEYARRGMLKAVRYGHAGAQSSLDKNTQGSDVMWQSVDSFKDLETCSEMLKSAYGQKI